MLAQLTTPQPAEDAAISNLLEIDLRDQQDLDVWEEKAAQTSPKRRAYSFHKPQPPKLAVLPKQPPPEPHNARSDYDQELMRLSHSDAKEGQQDWKNSKLMSRSSQLSEGEFWMGKVNWMPAPPKKEHSSQPKLNKRICFGLEAAHRKEAKKGLRYEDQEKTQEREYKTHLISSLFPCSDRAEVRAERTSPKNIEQSQPNFPLSPLKRTASKQPRDAEKLNGQVQQYMRETLKRIYQKSRNEEGSSQPKPAESERSSMIRELLINLESARDHVQPVGTFRCPQESHEGAPPMVVTAAKGVEAVVSSPQVPQRKFYLHQRHVLNLNLQAEKEYRSRSINQWTIKRPLKH